MAQGAWRRLATWTPLHTLVVIWAAYLGPLVLLWGLRSNVAAAYGPVLMILLVATGWLVPWWFGALCLAGASVLLSIMGPTVVPLQIGVHNSSLNPGLATYSLGLLFLGLGRSLRWGWGYLNRARRADDEMKNERERAQQLALVFRAAAHEIANPLNPLGISIGLLRRNPTIQKDEQLTQLVARMDRSQQRLTRLVSDFQGVARGLQGDMMVEKQDTDLAPLLQEVAAEQGPLARSAGLTWKADIAHHLRCHADPHRVVQAVANLCQNAVRYTPHGGQIELKAWSEGPDALVQVRDTGVGLTRFDMERLFEPFTRIHPEHEGGAGLGLWIVRRIARSHGGDVEVESGGPGRGATFRLRIRSEVAPSHTDSHPSPSSAPA
ncbi:MAG: sensor histidine kinase [Thermoplasmatota archaeon]